MKFRELTTASGRKILLGKNAKNNDELVSMFKGEKNIILHTALPGSPFGVLKDVDVKKKDIKEAAIAVASKSQDYRDNKSNVEVHQFTGKDVSKRKAMKAGTWVVKNKYKIIKVKKKKIEKFIKKLMILMFLLSLRLYYPHKDK